MSGRRASPPVAIGPSLRLRFRRVGAPGERYPAWVRSLDGHSGVYVIREYDGRRPAIVYVGESHTDRLYGTLTRHWQAWSRHGRLAREFSAHDPGLIYDRSRCDAAAVVTSACVAVELQNALIGHLTPRDNIIAAGLPPADLVDTCGQSLADFGLAGADAVPF
ncbi:MAG: hypothetical protein R3B06_31005 [Kofleriaceae bacterium]